MEEERQRMEKEKKRGGAAVCRTEREIKGASPFIDCIKIGLHLQLSYCCCLFVCLDKSCDLAERTLCLLSIQGTRVENEGWTDTERKRRETKKKKITLQQNHSWFLLASLCACLKPVFITSGNNSGTFNMQKYCNDPESESKFALTLLLCGNNILIN